MFVRFSTASVLALVAGVCLFACGDDEEEASERPYATALFALNDMKEDTQPFIATPPVVPLTGSTARLSVHLSKGGERFRIKLANYYGASALAFDVVHFARATGLGTIDPATDTSVTFDGTASVSIPPGGSVLSDPIAITLADLADAYVSVYASGSLPTDTAERSAINTQYSVAGNAVSSAALSNPTTTQTRWWLQEVDVLSRTTIDVVVPFGDSITEGVASTRDAHASYPDQLSVRVIAGNNASSTWSVANGGLGGNRWLHDVFGPRGVERFERDVLEVSGVSATIFTLGINDIGFQALVGQSVTADEMIAAMTNAIDQAHARGIAVYLGTLTPFKGAFYWSEANEAIRQTLTAWVNANTSVEGVFDFGATLGTPGDPQTLQTQYDSGDHLHLSDTGYGAMAGTVDLDLLRSN
jgi:lysophospholipase L1-like esterase